MHTTSERVASNIRAEMARRGWLIQGLAEEVGLSRTALSRRLNGWSALTIDEVEEIAGLMGVRVSTLLGEA